MLHTLSLVLDWAESDVSCKPDDSSRHKQKASMFGNNRQATKQNAKDLYLDLLSARAEVRALPRMNHRVRRVLG